MVGEASDLNVVADGLYLGRVQWTVYAGRHEAKFSTFVEMIDKTNGRCEMMGFRGPLFYDDAKPNIFHGSASDLPNVFMARCSPDLIKARLTMNGSVEELEVYRSSAYPEAAFLLTLFSATRTRPESLILEHRLS